jgi:hypothetical protein
MSDLERALAELDVDWPATPAFDYRRRRRPWLVPVLVLVLVVAAAFAVPQSRGAIVRFFHLGADRIERVQRLPSAQERAMRESLGAPTTRAVARQLLGRPFGAPGARVYLAGRVVSTLLPGNVLFSELQTGADPFLLKKFAGAATTVEPVSIDGAPGVWIFGGRHVFLSPTLPPRYAGNTLVWQRGGITYRLEGRGLTLARATALARRLR